MRLVMAAKWKHSAYLVLVLAIKYAVRIVHLLTLSRLVLVLFQLVQTIMFANIAANTAGGFLFYAEGG